jgi:hypothetical protein
MLSDYMKKTQYNEDFANTEKFDEETCFYMQLTEVEKYEYLELELEELQKRQESLIAHCDLIQFMTDRKHPNDELYKTHHTGFYHSDTPTYEIAYDLDNQIKEVKSKLEINHKRILENLNKSKQKVSA